MDFNWMPYFNGFWILPLLCLLFMAIMMLGCRGTAWRFGRGDRGAGCCSTDRNAPSGEHDAGRLRDGRFG
jgi:hypothetical protein